MAAPLKRFGDYYLIKKIATGGMAEIHLARTRGTTGPDKYVALKMIHPRYMEDGNFHQMIMEEAKIAVQLNHPNIGQVFDLGKADGRYFLVMEFIDGYDLSRLQDICREKNLRLPVDVAAFIGREVCEGLSYAHSRRDPSGRALELIHRDISPQNILLSFKGSVKIIDFGIAKVSTRMQQTHAGVIKGKFYYMSPEQAGANQVDQRSDLFSLGICLWESLCGRSLFRKKGGPSNPLAILHEIRSMPIPRVREFRRDCPKELDEIVARALSRDLDRRYKSASHMKVSMDAYLKSHAPELLPILLNKFMVQAFEKEETSKEVSQPSQLERSYLSRREFLPGDNSMIFEVDPQDAQTGVLEISFKKDSGDTQILDGSEIMKAMAQFRQEAEESLHSSKQPLSGTEQGKRDSRNLKKKSKPEKGAVAPTSRNRKQAQVRVPETSDPSTQTHMLSSHSIRTASKVFENRSEDRVRIKSKAKQRTAQTQQVQLSLSAHPLFRWLVLALLVLCILSVSLVLLVHRRGLEQDQLILERNAPTHSQAQAPSPIPAKGVN
ncbi:MAG TPA: serine/threonine protein kinase [Myxococcales bacterium]|nr:serine/threonine protein kinase [Myxococcales bacterium]HIN86121.1 serine/threonine protein kinase [Myxococcales bacterium]